MAEPLRATFYSLKKHNSTRGGVLLGATVITGVLSIVLIGIVIAIGFAMLSPFFSQGATPQSPEFIGAIFGTFALAFLFLVALYVLFAAYEAACLRWMIRGEAPGWFGLTLGADTWRVYGGYWLWFAINMVVSTVVSTIATAIMFMAMPAVIESGSGATGFGQLVLMQFAINGIYYIVMLFIAVRFAPAAATSIARRKFAFFDAWKVTKGRFWALFGSFFISGIVYFVVFAALFAFVFATMFNGQFPGAGATTEEINAAFISVFTPQNLLIIGGLYLLLFLTGIVYVVFSFGVNARAAIAAVDEGKIEGDTPNIAQVFS